MGRTLELTRTVAAEVYLPDPERAAKLAEGLYEEHLRRQLPAAPEEAGEAPSRPRKTHGRSCPLPGRSGCAASRGSYAGSWSTCGSAAASGTSGWTGS